MASVGGGRGGGGEGGIIPTLPSIEKYCPGLPDYLSATCFQVLEEFLTLAVGLQ